MSIAQIFSPSKWGYGTGALGGVGGPYIVAKFSEGHYILPQALAVFALFPAVFSFAPYSSEAPRKVFRGMALGFVAAAVATTLAVQQHEAQNADDAPAYLSNDTIAPAPPADAIPVPQPSAAQPG